jgi:PKD repeat protein
LNALSVPVTYNTDVEQMMNMVNQNTVYKYGADLTGDNTITVGGATYQIYSRNTYDTDIDIATQYAYEFFQAKGLVTEYHQWYSGRNVVATKTGTTKPTELVLVVAHLDSMPAYGYAPGADDNASGSVGVMVAAEIMSQYNFERTIRFILFTGEEQWMLGSEAYANDIYYAGDNVVAVLNLDMIGWDSWGGPVLRLHTRYTSSSGYTADKAIADTFVDVVNVYGMTNVLTPMIEADEAPSDHAAFWWVGYPAIMAAEDDYDDFCANYHTSYDTVSTLNLPYWTNYIKAGVGTAAHLAYPVTTGGSPTSSFTHTANLLTVNFTDTSTCTNCTIQSWAWNFGDGATSTLQNPSHTYRAAGTYTVTLTVTSNTGQTNTSTASVTVADQTQPYCTASGVNQTYEWIAGVAVGGLNNTSGPSPYTDYTAQSANLTAGSSVNISLTPGFSGSAYSEYWKVWIDYNGDGDFIDPGEEVFSDMTNSTASGSFTVPATAVGSTRMRVSMDYSGFPAACGTLAYGEVEDYTVTIR